MGGGGEVAAKAAHQLFSRYCVITLAAAEARVIHTPMKDREKITRARSAVDCFSRQLRMMIGRRARRSEFFFLFYDERARGILLFRLSLEPWWLTG